MPFEPSKLLPATSASKRPRKSYALPNLQSATKSRRFKNISLCSCSIRELKGVNSHARRLELFKSITEILDRMAAETARISKREIGGFLSVRATPGFVRWLVPRLGTFRTTNPDIDLHLTGSIVLPDFASEDVDVNIRWGFEPKPTLLSTPLMASTRYPVISPDLLRKGAPVNYRRTFGAILCSMRAFVPILKSGSRSRTFQWTIRGRA